MDFSEYMDDEWRARFGEGDLENLTIDGEITSIPFEKAGAVFYYNKEVFEKAGITEFPKTWDELLEACSKDTGRCIYSDHSGDRSERSAGGNSGRTL